MSQKIRYRIHWTHDTGGRSVISSQLYTTCGSDINECYILLADQARRWPLQKGVIEEYQEEVK